MVFHSGRASLTAKSIPSRETETEGRDDKMTLFDFYKDRISSCPFYGFKAGHEILRTVTRTAFYDSQLTLHEFNSIMILAEKCHIKMMEDNYNDGWKDK